MPKQKQTKSEAPKSNEKTAVKAAFLEWCALPENMREPKLAGEFAKLHKVNQATLSKWKHSEDFELERRKLTKKWMSDKMPAVLKALYDGVIENKRGADAKVLLQYVEDWIPKESVETKADPEVSEQIEALRNSLKDMIDAVRKAN